MTSGEFFFLNQKYHFIAHWYLLGEDIHFDSIQVGLKDLPGTSGNFIDISDQCLPELREEVKQLVIARIDA